MTRMSTVLRKAFQAEGTAYTDTLRKPRAECARGTERPARPKGTTLEKEAPAHAGFHEPG